MSRQFNRSGMGATAASGDPMALVSYTRALEASQTPQAEWPYLWLFPPAHSRHVLYQATLTVPAIGSTAVLPIAPPYTANNAYQVPDGFRFSLRGFVINGDAVQQWNQGSGDLVFNLAVAVAGGPRNVDYLSGLTTSFGSFTQGPFPILGRLEFESLDVLQWGITANANVTPGGNVIFGLMGHLYPTSEADNG